MLYKELKHTTTVCPERVGEAPAAPIVAPWKPQLREVRAVGGPLHGKPITLELGTGPSLVFRLHGQAGKYMQDGSFVPVPIR